MIISCDQVENILSFYWESRIYLNNLYFETDCTRLETDWTETYVWGVYHHPIPPTFTPLLMTYSAFQSIRGHNSTSYESNGHNSTSYESNGHNSTSYESSGHNSTSYKSSGHNSTSYESQFRGQLLYLDF